MTSSALTRREREVARLVAEGLTNREIAERLFISERTAEYHVEQIRNKLGFRSRAQIAAWITEQGADGQRVPAEPVIRPAQRGRGSAGRRLWVATALLLTLVASGVVALIARPWSATSPSGPTIETIAGYGSVGPYFAGGYTGDAGRADHATLSRPTDVVATRDGTIYVADCGNGVVRRIAHDRKITTWAGGGSNPLINGAVRTDVKLGFASNLTVDTQGQPYLLTNRSGAREVWTIKPDEKMALVTRLIPSGGEPLPCKYGNEPVGGLAFARDGTLFIADRAGDRVWRLAPDGKLTPYAGTGQAGCCGDSGPAIDAMLDAPIGLAVDDQQGALYIADSGNNRIRKVDSNQRITTVAGGGDYDDKGDGGPATQARLSFPFGVAVGRDGTIFIADTGNNRVRKITKGIIVALAGTHDGGYKGDGGQAARAELSGPEAVTLDENGDLLIADTENHRVRELLRVSP